MKVPRCRPTLTKKARAAAESVMDSGKFVKGPEAKALEEDFARYCGVDYAIAVNSGTSALYMSLRALDLKFSDDVIIPVNSFMATANAVANVCQPVFVDIDETANISVDEVRRVAKDDNVKAIMPVHLYGQMAEMNGIMEIAGKEDMVVIEDAAQAHGAEYMRRKAGSWGDMAGFSFFPTKNVGCAGDGGIITCKDETLANYLKALRDNGRMPGSKHDCAFPGLNLRMSEIQAAIARENLKTLDENNKKRIKLAKVYKELLPKDKVGIPLPENGKHIYHLYTIRCEDRDGLAKHLKENEIGCNINYDILLNKLSAYSTTYGKASFPVAEKMSEEILSIPMDSTLMEEEITYVANKICEFYK